MSFDFNLFDLDKEMESLNNKLENKLEISEERPLTDIKKNINISNIENGSILNPDNLLLLKHIENKSIIDNKKQEREQEQEQGDNFGKEFIIIEKNDDTSILSASEELKRKREEKKKNKITKKGNVKKRKRRIFKKF